MATNIRFVHAGEIVIAAAVIGSAVLVCHGQAEPSWTLTTTRVRTEQSQNSTFRTAVNYVRVDVNVSDRSGRPVQNLTVNDFEVSEDGKLQKIESFNAVVLDGGLDCSGADSTRTISSASAPEDEAAKDDVRLFAMFLDDYHVERAPAIRVRDQLLRFVDTQLGPSDLIGVMYPLEPIASVRIMRDRLATTRAILQFVGRKYDYSPSTDEERQYILKVNAVDVERIRNHVSWDALRSLILRLGALKVGRKSLIVVSEGYFDPLPTSMVPFYGGLEWRLTQPPPEEPPIDVNRELLEISNLANRNNVAIYTIDPRALGAGDPKTIDTLKALAEDSGGRAIVNRNDVALAMKQIMIDSSAFYLLGYNSSPLMQDGKFHEIRVRVLRPGLDVRHRNGYWAVKNDSTAKAAKPDLNTPNPVEAALRATLPSGRGVIRTWIGTAAGENGSTRVTVVWEPVPPRPGEPVRRADRPVRVILTAGNSAGLRYFRGAVSDLREPTPVPPSGGGVAFEVPPGDVELRFSVEQEGNGVIDAYSQQLEVPDFSAMGTLLGTPEIYRARTQPELQRLRAQSHPMPTLSRDFSRVESIMVRFPVYVPSGTTATLTGRLMNRAGQTIADISVVPLDNIQSWSQAEVSLANLPAGEYGLALNVTAESGEADCIVAFRVTP